MRYHFKNLVFEGGGIKGIAYIGALDELEKREILSSIKRVGGTSAGAIIATIVALNYKVPEISNIMTHMNFKSFFDDSWGFIRDLKRILTQYGWYKGDKFREWIGSLIKNKLGNENATFNDLNKLKDKNGFKELYIIGANLSTGFAEVFSYEYTPRMCIADAVRISMSIPFFFVPKINIRGDYYCDGGLIDNYPIKLFDREKYLENKDLKIETDYYLAHNLKLPKNISPYVYNKETLGFRLDTAKEIAVFRDQAEPPKTKIDSFFDFTFAVLKTLLNIQESIHLHSDDWQRTIYIDTKGVKTTDFDIDNAKKEELINSGREGVIKYFEWYDNPAEKPINRPY